MLVAVPDIEENFALPVSAAEALPDLTPAEELNMRARTITFLAELQGTPLITDDAGQEQASKLAHQMMTDPQLRPEYAKYPNEVIAYLAGMVAQSNCMIVDDLAELKLYCVNKLVWEVENAKMPKDRLSALRLLGEVDGVDAYKRRTESTITVKPIAEVEKELQGFLEKLEYQMADDAQVVEEVGNDDVHP